MEPGEATVMRRQPLHRDDAILSRAFVSRMFLYGVLITATALAAFLWALQYSPSRATTISFMTLALAQVFHLATARGVSSRARPAPGLANPYALGAAGLAIGLQLIAVYVNPIAHVLQTAKPGLIDWLVIIALAAVPAAVGRALRQRSSNTDPVEDIKPPI
jgi:Ca2+-transporting ATPase